MQRTIKTPSWSPDPDCVTAPCPSLHSLPDLRPVPAPVVPGLALGLTCQQEGGQRKARRGGCWSHPHPRRESSSRGSCDRRERPAARVPAGSLGGMGLLCSGEALVASGLLRLSCLNVLLLG